VRCDGWRQVVGPRDVGGNSGCAVGVVGLRKLLPVRHICVNGLTGTAGDRVLRGMRGA
jgi:hypothetical protein